MGIVRWCMYFWRSLGLRLVGNVPSVLQSELTNDCVPLVCWLLPFTVHQAMLLNCCCVINCCNSYQIKVTCWWLLSDTRSCADTLLESGDIPNVHWRRSVAICGTSGSSVPQYLCLFTVKRWLPQKELAEGVGERNAGIEKWAGMETDRETEAKTELQARVKSYCLGGSSPLPWSRFPSSLLWHTWVQNVQCCGFCFVVSYYFLFLTQVPQKRRTT